MRTARHKDTLIAILSTPLKGEVIILGNIQITYFLCYFESLCLINRATNFEETFAVYAK